MMTYYHLLSDSVTKAPTPSLQYNTNSGNGLDVLISKHSHHSTLYLSATIMLWNEVAHMINIMPNSLYITFN